jgi:hypothetical protein
MSGGFFAPLSRPWYFHSFWHGLSKGRALHTLNTRYRRPGPVELLARFPILAGLILGQFRARYGLRRLAAISRFPLCPQGVAGEFPGHPRHPVGILFGESPRTDLRWLILLAYMVV